jgi:hypothetical protein
MTESARLKQLQRVKTPLTWVRSKGSRLILDRNSVKSMTTFASGAVRRQSSAVGEQKDSVNASFFDAP